MRIQHIYNILRCISLIVLLLIGGGDAFAQTIGEDTQEFNFYFHIKSADYDSLYMDNKEQLAALDTFLTYLENNPSVQVTHLAFRGAASPDGNYSVNRKYARLRMKWIEDIVRSRIEVPDSLVSHAFGIAWLEFAEVVRKSDLKKKQTILNIIARGGRIVNVTEGFRTDTRVLQLIDLEYGWLWLDLVKNYFDPLRTAKVTIRTQSRVLPPPQRIEQPESMVTVQEVHTAFAQTVEEEADTSSLSPKKKAPSRRILRPYTESLPLTYPGKPPRTKPYDLLKNRPFMYQLHVKTNALGWGIGMSNAAVEFDLCKHLSLNVPVYYSAWNYFVPDIKFRTFMLQPGLRFYIRENQLGWFVGAHFGMAYYNIAVDGSYRYQDHDGHSPALGGGLDLGYRMPITRSGHWWVEFSIGAGGYALHYDRFYNEPNGLMIDTQKKTYWGIDQANISFIYSINLEKGGRR